MNDIIGLPSAWPPAAPNLVKSVASRRSVTEAHLPRAPAVPGSHRSSPGDHGGGLGSRRTVPRRTGRVHSNLRGGEGVKLIALRLRERAASHSPVAPGGDVHSQRSSLVGRRSAEAPKKSRPSLRAKSQVLVRSQQEFLATPARATHSPVCELLPIYRSYSELLR